MVPDRGPKPANEGVLGCLLGEPDPGSWPWPFGPALVQWSWPRPLARHPGSRPWDCVCVYAGVCFCVCLCGVFVVGLLFCCFVVCGLWFVFVFVFVLVLVLVLAFVFVFVFV